MSKSGNKVIGYQYFKKRHSKYVYLLESDSHLKIGMSCDPFKRVARLNSYLPEESQRFVVVMFTECSDGVEARLTEKFLHQKFKDYQVLTDFEGAKTECFSKEIKADIMKELETLTRYQPFDPFITCHSSDLDNFLKLNKIDLVTLCKMVGKKFTDTTRLKMKLSMSCILANIKLAKRKQVIYNKNDVVNLSSGGRMCNLLLEKLFLYNTLLTEGVFTIPEEISIKYDVRVGKRLRSVYFKNSVRPLFLITIHSYTNNLSEHLTRMIENESSYSKYTAEANMYKAYDVVVGGKNCVVRRK